MRRRLLAHDEFSMNSALRHKDMNCTVLMRFHVAMPCFDQYARLSSPDRIA